LTSAALALLRRQRDARQERSNGESLQLLFPFPLCDSCRVAMRLEKSFVGVPPDCLMVYEACVKSDAIDRIYAAWQEPDVLYDGCCITKSRKIYMVLLAPSCHPAFSLCRMAGSKRIRILNPSHLS
jgi:hypothetical protein